MKQNVIHRFLRWSFLVFAALACTGGFLQAAEKDFVVVIDAGHGGHDPGALGRKGKEKHINLKVALKLGALIESNCPDTRVIYTRNRDVFVPLHERAEIANKAKADLFISIHTNSIASRTTKISGAETYTLGLHKTQENLEVAQKENSVILIEEDYQQQYSGFNPNSSESYIMFEFLQDKNMTQSVRLAQFVQQQFKQTARRIDKGVHQAGFLVLRETSMPSVLIELGYITNPNEEAYLLSMEGTNAMSRSIYQAFLNYKEGQTAHPKDGTAAALPPTATTEERNERPRRDGQPQRDERPKREESPKCDERPSEAPVRASDTATTPERTPEPAAGPTADTPADTPADEDRPVFKIQFMTAGRKLPAGSKQFKGLSPVHCYQENGIYKYTFGSDTDYNKVLRLKRTKVDSKFKDAFIIAFKRGQKMNVQEAIKEFKKRKNR